MRMRKSLMGSPFQLVRSVPPSAQRRGGATVRTSAAGTFLELLTSGEEKC